MCRRWWRTEKLSNIDNTPFVKKFSLEYRIQPFLLSSITPICRYHANLTINLIGKCITTSATNNRLQRPKIRFFIWWILGIKNRTFNSKIMIVGTLTNSFPRRSFAHIFTKVSWFNYLVWSSSFHSCNTNTLQNKLRFLHCYSTFKLQVHQAIRFSNRFDGWALKQIYE